MEIDKSTLEHLSILHKDDEHTIFNKLDLTVTHGGRNKLRTLFTKPLQSIGAITDRQDIIKLMQGQEDKWPANITNGTLMVMEKYLESVVDTIPEGKSVVASFSYKYLHKDDYSLVEYSTSHCFEFIKGLKGFIDHLAGRELPASLNTLTQRTKILLDKPDLQVVTERSFAQLDLGEKLHLGNYLRYKYRKQLLDLMEVYYTLDAYRSMALATQKYNLKYPTFITADTPQVRITGLHHLLLKKPVSYTVALEQRKNFVFLTGANMAGKSTFIKSIGIAVYLAHIGMAVPASDMSLTLFDGIITNMDVSDDISRGESYFYNEVRKVKDTLGKINNNGKWLVLIDELFKGTNIEDAMRCSSTVIKGLLKIKNSVFIVSTHLYEIANELKDNSNLVFKYFETELINDELSFTYQLKDGVSQDRLGYLILKREGVIDMLEKL